MDDIMTVQCCRETGWDCMDLFYERRREWSGGCKT